MPKSYTTWRSLDGELFETRREAIEHEVNQTDARVYDVLISLTQDFQLDDSVLAPLAAELSYRLEGETITWGETPTHEDATHPETA